MINSCKTKMNYKLVISIFLFLKIANVFGQPADAVPIIKYAINNYASISKAACDTCELIIGKPLQRYKPIPLPPLAGFEALSGVDISYIPGISAPNFIGGGSPEIKGLVKSVAGMTDFYAERFRKTDILYFKSGAQGVAVSQSGKIFTSSSTFLPGTNFNNPNEIRDGFFSFKSSPQRLPAFNSRSEEVFLQSPEEVVFEDEVIDNDDKEIGYFALHPANENIIYAAFKNPENDTKILARKNRAGNWEKLDWDLPGGLGLANSVWGALAVDQDGNLYVADATHHVIVKVTFDNDGKADSWQIIGGEMDSPGFVNDEDGLDARFNEPSGICIDNLGNIYIGDKGNNVIRKINIDGEVTTFAGTGDKGFKDDKAADAKFWGPAALAYNEKTDVLYVVDFGNKLIREIEEIGGEWKVSTLTGNAGSLNPTEPVRFALTLYYVLSMLNLDPDEAKLVNPTGIAIDPSGLGLYLSDGQYIKYVNTFKGEFEVIASIRDTIYPTLLGLPILPPGIFMNPNNGSFFGTPVLPWPPTTYLVRAKNNTGKSIINGFIAFEVVDCPEVTDTVKANIVISPKQLPFTWNGQVLNGSGTAFATLLSSAGCDSLVELILEVRPEFNYNCEPYLLSLGLPINPIVPTTSGSKIDSFSVSPPLPNGLILNMSTGQITGTPTTYATNQPFPSIGPKIPPQYPAPWTLEADRGADITQVQISDCNQNVLFENNSAFQSLVGSAGQGTGTPGAYTDFSRLGPIKMVTNTQYSIRLSNALSSQNGFNLNQLLSFLNFMNSYAVYIDYNRDGDFADSGERVYISAGPQRDVHSEVFNLIIPASAASGVTKMRIYAVEAQTRPWTYTFIDANNFPYSVTRSTEQALSFYPFYNDISFNGEQDFKFNIDYGEFEDYNIEIQNPATQTYLIKGRNKVDTAQAIVKISVNDPTRSTTNLTICSTELPYTWNGLIFTKSETQTAHLINSFGADSAATLILFVKQASTSVVSQDYCGPFTYRGIVYTTTGDYPVLATNAVGCDSLITFKFRQLGTTSTTTVEVIPSALPYLWNNLSFSDAGTYSTKLINAVNCDSVATLVLKVRFNVYYPPTNTLLINQAIQPIIPQFEDNYTPGPENPNFGCSITPNLPNGLNLEGISGIIYGTPTALSPTRTYTITWLQQGAIPSTFTLSVGQPTSSTTTIDNCGPYTWNGVEYPTPGIKTATFKNQYGFDSIATLSLSIRNLSATVVPLFLNKSEIPYTWNGLSITQEGTRIIHLINAVGCDSAVTANVTISPKISYQSPNILSPNLPIVPIAPIQAGGFVLNYTIQPSLVNGLLFDELTGIISGTPTDTLLQPLTHTIRAFNNAGADSVKVIIAVCNPIATSFIQNACNQFVWNDSTYTVSTTHTRTLKNRGGCDSVVTMNLIIKNSTTGPTTTIEACGIYEWFGVIYDTTGLYSKVYTNAVGCDSTIYLDLTIKYPTYYNRYVNLNQSDLPYTWRGLTFTEPSTQSIILVNSVGCDSTLFMTVSISNLLPDISYVIADTVLYWEETIKAPIVMTNSGTPVPAAKLGERDTLITFSNGPGDFIKAIKGPDGAYYARVFNSSIIFKLNSSGVWTNFADAGGVVNAMAMDKLGNLYIGVNSIPTRVKKITPDGVVSILAGSPLFFSIDALAVDVDNNLIIHSQQTSKLFKITKFNLSTNQYVEKDLDNTPFFDFGPEDLKTDSKGNIYMYRNAGSNIVKIKPNWQMSAIGRRSSPFNIFQPGNGTDAMIPWIASLAIDLTNDNVYVMANGNLLRVDTAENITAITGRWFDQFKDQIFRVDDGKISIVNSSTGILYTANAYGVGSLPFMDNYGVFDSNIPTVNFADFDQRIRLDSMGAIVGTPRALYSSIGTIYANNTATAYSIIAANQYGISTAPMRITTKSISYVTERFLTYTLPFIWRGRSFNAATDTATFLVTNKSLENDTLYKLHLVYEGAPEPIISKGDCEQGQITLSSNTAAKNSINFDGANFGLIKNVVKSGTGQLPYFGVDVVRRPDNSFVVYFHSAFEVWIKPTMVSGTQYLLTRDTVKTNGTFFGYSIQNGKFVYEFTKGVSPFVDYKLSSVSNIEPNVWTHVAASYYDSTMYIFINGNLEGSLQTADRFMNLFYNEPGTNVGIFPDFSLAGLGSQLGYKGEMDELRLWGTRRNADSIKATMNTIVDPSSAGLGLYYRFDEDSIHSTVDIAKSCRRATFSKPVTNISSSTAPIDFASYQWMPGGATTKSIDVNPLSDTIYTLKVTDYKGTAGSDSLSVIATPLATISYGGSPFCSTEMSGAVTQTGISGGTYTSTPGLSINATTGEINPSISIAGTYTVTYTIAASGGCPAIIAMTTVTINPQPTATIIYPGSPFSSTSTIGQVNLIGTSGGVYSSTPGLTIDVSTGEINPSTSTLGTYTVTYTIAASGNCPKIIATTSVTIVFLTVSISDPCACLNNATTLQNGQFSDSVVVKAASGQIWKVAQITGLYNIASPNPPITPNAIPVGTILVETPSGSGIYVLEGIHVDSIGYSIEVENGRGDTLKIGNVCTYPSPKILLDTKVFCANGPNVPLIGDPGDGDIVIDSFTINGIRATEINPSVLGAGVHTITYTVDGGAPTGSSLVEPGCVQSVSTTIEVVALVSMPCFSEFNISLSDNCNVNNLEEVLFRGVFHPALHTYRLITQSGEVINVENIKNYIGQKLKYEVISLCNNNSCWGYINIEDKLPSVAICPTLPEILCTDAVVFPTLQYKDCSAVQVSFSDVKAGDDCTGRTVTRTWKLVDAYGNVGTNCVQTIKMKPITLDSLKMPKTPIDINECNSINTSPSGLNALAGIAATDVMPYVIVNGVPRGIESNLCNIFVNYKDVVIEATCSKKIIRTWTLFDWCTQRKREFIQLIKLSDTDKPVVTAPKAFTVESSPWTCAAEFLLPAGSATDNCGASPVISIRGPQGVTVVDRIVSGLKPGQYTFAYTATDKCENVSLPKTVTVTVVDKSAPVLVAKEKIVINLTANGLTRNDSLLAEGKLFTTNVDNGSYDMCSPVKLEVRRKGIEKCDTDNDEWRPFVKFCCEDVGGRHMVEMRGTDVSGNSSITWVEVLVEAKSAATITCNDRQVYCADNYGFSAVEKAVNSLSIEHTVTGGVLCANLNVTYQDASGLNQCNVGSVIRTFRLKQGATVIGSCTQRITVTRGFSELQVGATTNNVVYINSCTLPQDSINKYKPSVRSGECDIIGENISIDTFSIEDGVCKKWVVTYTYINWCNEYQRISRTVKFAFADNTDPIVTQDHPSMFEAGNNAQGGSGADASSCAGTIVLKAKAADDSACDADGWIKWTAVVNENGGNVERVALSASDASWAYQSTLPALNTWVVADANLRNYLRTNLDISISANLMVSRVSPTAVGGSLTLPSYTASNGTNGSVNWIAIDGCGNSGLLTTTYMVADKKAPTPYCVFISTALMKANEQGVKMVEIWAVDFDRGSFDNCTSKDALLYSFDTIAPLAAHRGANHFFDATGAKLTDNAATRDQYIAGEVYYWNKDSRSAGRVFNSIGVKPMKMSVLDGSGNRDFCEITLTVIDNNGGVSTLAGKLENISGEGISKVNIKIDAPISEFPKYNTVDMKYAYSELINNTYMITPSKVDDYTNGVSTLDLVLIQRHILGLSKLTQAEMMIAADANNDGKINVSDLLELRRLIIGMTVKLSNNDSWRFVPMAYELDAVNPYNAPKSIKVDLTSNMMDADFRGIKIGDVSNDAKASLRNAVAEPRSNGAIQFETEDQSATKGGEMMIPVTSSNFENVNGFQFTMNGMKVVEVLSGLLSMEGQNIGLIDGNTTTMSWSSDKAVTAQENEVLFTIRAVANKGGKISEAVTLDSKVTKAEAYTGSTYEEKDVKLTFTNKDAAEAEFALYQNESNPFKAITVVNYKLPKAGKAKFTLKDVTGKVIYTRDVESVKGMNRIEFSRGEIPTSGIVFYTIVSGTYTATKAMIVVE
jgi:hypothetical protein